MSNDVEIDVKVDGSEATVGLDDIGQKARDSGEKITTSFVRARDELGRFVKMTDTARQNTDHWTDSNGRLRDSLGKFVKAGQDSRGVLDDVGQAGEKAGSILSQMFSEVTDLLEKGFNNAVESAQDGLKNLGSSALSGLQSALQALGIAALFAVGGFAALAPALLVAGGAAGAAATGFAAAGIGLATLMIGFGGIGAALSAHTKAMSGAGKAATDTAEQEYQAAKRIHDAERSLADAKLSEVDAAKAVNQARQDEITRLKELDITLEGQKASQADAAQALVEAKEKQRRADQAGSAWEKQNAANAVADAQAQYDSITQKLSESTAEKQKAAKVGVDGSDQVQAALKREAQAHEQVIKAQEALADAHHKTAVAATGAAGGIDLFNQAMQKLSPNAQKLVYALLDIQKRFDSIKKQVQDRLLAGFDKSVTDLADKWLPHLGDILGNTADHLNSFGKKLMGALGDSEFIKNIERAGKEGGKFIDKMSTGTDALVDAFGRLAGHSGPVLQVIGKAIEGIFVWFDKWIKSADKSGKLDSFMKMAADTLQTVFDIGGKVFHIVGQLIEILFPSSKSTSDSIFDSVEKGLDSVSKWLGNPTNQKSVQQFADDVSSFLKWLFKDGIPIVGKLVKVIGEMAATTILVIKAVANLWNSISSGASKAFNVVKNAVSNFGTNIKNAFSSLGHSLAGIWDPLRNGFRNALNWIIGKWNNLSFSIGGGSFLGMDIPSARFDTPNIPYLAHGGIAGGLIMAGEHGRELIRVPQGSSVMPHGQTEGMMSQGGGGGKIMLGFERSSGSKLMDAIVDGLQTYVKSRGGNVQVALGRHGA